MFKRCICTFTLEVAVDAVNEFLHRGEVATHTDAKVHAVAARELPSSADCEHKYTCNQYMF